MERPAFDYQGHPLGHLRFGAGFQAVYGPDTAAQLHKLLLAPEPPLYRECAASRDHQGD